MQEQIFKDLEKWRVRFSKVETDLEMPKNYLSRFKNPENKLPVKWVEPLMEYIKKNSPLYELFPKPDDHFEEKPNDTPFFQPPPAWIKKIEDYCQDAGIVPEDLITTHQLMGKKEKHFETVTTTGEVKLQNLNAHPESNYSIHTGLSKDQLEIRKKKLGF